MYNFNAKLLRYLKIIQMVFDRFLAVTVRGFELHQNALLIIFVFRRCMVQAGNRFDEVMGAAVVKRLVAGVELLPYLIFGIFGGHGVRILLERGISRFGHGVGRIAVSRNFIAVYALVVIGSVIWIVHDDVVDVKQEL